MLKRLGIAIVVLIALLGAAAVVGFFVVGRAYRIPSSAMEPTLHCAEPGEGCTAGSSDHILALRFVGPIEPDRGDLVVFETPERALQECGAGGTFVKRLIALPGETWSLRRGVVYINGKPLSEPYIEKSRRGTDAQPARQVPSDHYIFLGDNRTHSCDSRSWGSVPRGNLIGEVVAVYWPPSRWGLR